MIVGHRLKFTFGFELDLLWLFLYESQIFHFRSKMKEWKLYKLVFQSEFMVVKSAAGKYESFSCYDSITVPFAH